MCNFLTNNPVLVNATSRGKTVDAQNIDAEFSVTFYDVIAVEWFNLYL